MRAAPVLAVALVAAALAIVALAGCGSPALSGKDALAGYWIGGGQQGLMTLMEVQKNGDKYVVLANPDAPVGEGVKEGESLVVESHAVTTTLTPAPGDKLTVEFSGEMFKTPATTTLQRVDETQYADAATGYGISQIKRGLAMWKAGGGKEYPPAKEVTPTGMLGQMIRWPNNLFTGKPMQPGQDKGDYVYEQIDGGNKFSLIGHLSDGGTVGK
jgi:hypothetical protein